MKTLIPLCRLNSQQLIFQVAVLFFLLAFPFVLPKLSLAANETIKSTANVKSQISAIQLTPNEKAWIEKRQPVKVAVKSGWMPIEFKLENDKHRGISIDYLSKIGELLHIDFIVVNYTENIQPDQADIISGVSGNSLKNSHFQLLSQPFIDFPFAIYTDKHNKKQAAVNSLENLNGYNVAVFKSGPLGQKIRENYPRIKLMYVDIADEAFDELKSGRVDAYVGNELVIDYHINIHRLKFVKKSGLTPFTSTISMAVRKDQPELASIINKGIVAVGQNNKALLDNWKPTEKPYNRILSFIFAGLSIIFSLVLFRFYRLKQSIKKQTEATQLEIWRQANFDHLTNLPNRHLLQNRLEQARERAERSQLPIAVLFIDLDNFKKVNDQSGHKIGDKLLIEAADRIGKCVRADDTTARFGGDEFIVVMSDLKDIYSLENSCQKILAELEKPFTIDGTQFYISASIGVTLYPDDSRDPEELLNYADQAMYEAKKQGRNRFQFFTESIQKTSLKRLSITSDIREALLKEQFVLHYQPIINLKDSSVMKAEALIRWNHPTKGVISPIDFIPLAEESGLIHELGDWIFNQALKDLLLIREHLGLNFQLSINVSPYQFRDSDNLLSWADRIKKLGIPGQCIAIEITEGLLLDPTQEVIQIISALRGVGIEFSIDDFGTGYSAIAYLKKFNIDYVKIDKSFVHNLQLNNYDAVLCEAIINMARKLKIKVVAEGIETSIQKELLEAFICDYGQGYLIARPQPLDQLLAFISEHKIRA